MYLNNTATMREHLTPQPVSRRVPNQRRVRDRMWRTPTASIKSAVQYRAVARLEVGGRPAATFTCPHPPCSSAMHSSEAVTSGGVPEQPTQAPIDEASACTGTRVAGRTRDVVGTW